MAAEAEAYALAAVSQAPEPFRRMLSDLHGGRPGVCTSGAWAVTQAGSPNMTVLCAAGSGFVLGSETATQGMYFCQSTTSTTLTITASNPTNPRRDLVVARIRDNQYATGPTSAFALEVVAGTPAASPVDPTVPANCLVIARVAVAANDTAIQNAEITDLRTATAGQARATALGGVVVCTSTTRPTSALYQGLIAWETDTKRLINYTGTAWEGVGVAGTSEVLTSQATSSTTFTDLATVGPAVSVLTGAKALVHLHCQMSPSADGFMAITVTGATTISTSFEEALYMTAAGAGGWGGTFIISGLNPGLNTFTAKYAVTSGTTTFLRRRMAVIPCT